MSQRHPARGAIAGFLIGLGLAILALIYSLIRVEGPWLPLAIVLLFTVLGVVFAMFLPARKTDAAGSPVP